MSGIHHVTAISGKAARNLDFYTHVIGLRFVKKTVNFDDPGTYHLYYGDRVGNPGTILTFFPWEHAAPGRGGVGLAQQTTFRIPLGSIGYWTHRIVEKGVAHEALEKRFGEPVLSFTDPDGLSLALVGTAGAEFATASNSGNIPAEHAIRGFHGVTLMLDDAVPTAAVLRRSGIQAPRPRRATRPLPCQRTHRWHRRHSRGEGFSSRAARPRLGASHSIPG